MSNIVQMGIIVAAVVAAAYIVVKSLANYIKVAPNEVLVVYGRSYKWPDGTRRGYKLVTGGAVYCIPLLEKYQRLPLIAFQIKSVVRNVPSEQGVRVTVNAVASLKIGRTSDNLEAAATRFLGRTLDEIGDFAQEVIEGGLRGVVATMTVEQLVKERTEFRNKTQEQITSDLANMGFVVDNFVIQDISDEHGYIDALGKKQTANVKRDAAIGEAAAKRDEDIEVSEAKREADEKSSEARRIGETAKSRSDEEISNAWRQRDTVKAQNVAKVEAERAKIKIVADIAEAEEDKLLRVARVAAEKAEIEARIELEQKESVRKNEELQASEIVPAKRKKEAVVIQAEGAKESEIIKAQGRKTAVELEAEAERRKDEFESEGRIAMAKADQVELEAKAAGKKADLAAEASGVKARLEAEAYGSRAKLEAEAAGIKAKLEAEASGVEKKAEAYAKLDKVGKFLELLDRVPTIIDATGKAVREAGEGTLAPMSQAIGTGIANIDEIKIIDMGGGQGKDALTRLTEVVPKSIFNLLQVSHALGLQGFVKQLGDKIGVDPKVINEAIKGSAGDELADIFSVLKETALEAAPRKKDFNEPESAQEAGDEGEEDELVAKPIEEYPQSPHKRVDPQWAVKDQHTLNRRPSTQPGSHRALGRKKPPEKGGR